jgi:hypothetical protein
MALDVRPSFGYGSFIVAAKRMCCCTSARDTSRVFPRFAFVSRPV